LKHNSPSERGSGVEAPRNTRYYADHSADPVEVDKYSGLPRKVYWYYKNLFRQKNLFKQIEKIRKEFNIEVFNGVSGGIVPLTFYLDKKPRNAGIIFSDVDSWFTDVLPDMKKLWYRKYYSYNYALEKADTVDFLSPYILEGIRKRGINITDDRAAVAPCSFIDSSKCTVGSKSNLEIAFASRLEPDKNPMMFLHAAKIIHSEFPHIKFHILGEGSLVHEIEKFINKNNLKEVINFQFHKNPPEIFAGTSIFVSLQSNTNYPSQSVLEAMACGNAIIAAGTGDTKLFINENNGILINLNTDELVSAMKTLITRREKISSMGSYARKFAMENHTIEKYADYYLGLIEKLHAKIYQM
jgi:glycosyltransferase involved in cell wall biosynthesis